MGDSPVFLTGLPRTGKTALRQALGAHPRLSMTRKTRMWENFYGSFGDLSDPGALERCLEAMLHDPGVARLLPDATAVRQAFAVRDRTYPELFGVLQAQYARRLGKARWGEQSAHLEVYTEAIFSTWPEARMIHMVRHPFDWISTGSQRRPGGVGRELGKWTASAQLAIYNASRHRDRYRVVQFERLMSDPVPTLQEVVSFIGEESNFGMGQTLLEALPDDSPGGLVPGARKYITRAVDSLIRGLGYPDPDPEDRTDTVASRILSRIWFGARRTQPIRS
ncbi:MAG: sulfotransferase family protein [Actinomycetota bacterium]